MTKGVQPTSVENKTLSCVDKLFFPNLMAPRYVCGLSFFYFIHLPTSVFPPFCCSCCLAQVREKKGMKSSKRWQRSSNTRQRKKEWKRWREQYGRLTQAAINIYRCKVRGMIVQGKQVKGNTCLLLKSGSNVSPGCLRQYAF